jgi:hypothetical protein
MVAHNHFDSHGWCWNGHNGALGLYWGLNTTCSYCEPAMTTRRACDKPLKKKTILIVGCGLTRALMACQLVKKLSNHYHHKSQQGVAAKDDDIPQVDLMERATYPAGRFGSRATHGGAVADVGAQVLSTVNPDDPRALGGHGVTRANLRTAQSIVQKLLHLQLLQQAPNTYLGETDERMVWEGLWQHYVAPQGLSSVIEALIPPNVTPKFGVRIDAIVPTKEGRFQVMGVDRSSPSRTTLDHQQAQEEAPKQFSRVYDAVILCIPAPDVLSMQGVESLLDESSKHVLKHVGYDSRTCEAHFFDPRLRPALAMAFSHTDTNGTGKDGAKLEISLDDCDDDNNSPSHNISYITWQDPKRGIAMDDTDTLCAITVHSHAKQHVTTRLDETDVDRLLSQRTGLSSETIRNYRLAKKSISWTVSQMIRPMEAVVADPPSQPAWQCLSNASGSLVVCGDFMTQSSFVGCVASADAAATTVWNYLSKNDPNEDE